MSDNEYSTKDCQAEVLSTIRRVLKAYATDIVERSGAEAVYIIGSLAAGGFVLGKSDCDILAVGNLKFSHTLHNLCDSLGATSLKNILGDRELWLSFTARHISDLVYPMRPVGLWENKKSLALEFKKHSILGDILLLMDHGELLAGRDIRPRLESPTNRDIRRYYIWRTAAVRNSHLYQEPPFGLEHCAKAIIKRTREYFLLWTGNCPYNMLLLERDIRESGVRFPDPDLLSDAMSIRYSLRGGSLSVHSERLRAAVDFNRRGIAYLDACAKYDARISEDPALVVRFSWKDCSLA